MEYIRVAATGVEEAAVRAAAALHAGGVILYPTDTIYGLGADALNPDALKKLKALKKRDEGKPISILVSDIAMMEEYGMLNAASHALAERFLPGALTLVLPAKDTVPHELNPLGEIGIRIPADPFCTALTRAFGGPVTATSANVSGQETADTTEAILTQLEEVVEGLALTIDDGPRAGGKPSTIVDCTSETPRIIREGTISAPDLGLG